MPTEFAQEALQHLRDGSLFNWTVIPVFVLVIYVYSVEVERRNWNVFHFTQYAPVWAAPGDTAFLILIGLNIEISMMFAFLGIVAAKMLPQDRNAKILGVPNRWFLAIELSIFCVIVEIFLNAVDALTWDYWWWSARWPFLIVIFGYLHFFVVAFWVHDMKTLRSKALTVGSIYAIDAVSLVLFGVILGWI
jgi:hypothetical protein